MHQILHVISDLHLGGAAATDHEPAFQMCRPETHILLAGFIDRLPASHADTESHLVIAGDIVDFLAEKPFSAFTGAPVVACEKLASIFRSTAAVWDALARFAVERDGILTLMLGNHDIELSLPGVRQMFLDRLPGKRVRFIYDNEAFVLGPLLVEHGNRFDAWNAVPHGALRRVRSQLSRKLPVKPDFPALPGSRLVMDVINPLKVDYPFVDLLKPETAMALPIAAALGGVGLTEVWKSFDKFRASLEVEYEDGSGEPRDDNLVCGMNDADRDCWIEAQNIAYGDGDQVSATGDLLGRGATIVTAAMRTARTDALFLALRKLASLRRLHREAFDIGTEADTYLNPARRAAEAGFKVIVYGHTHLPKRVQLGQDAGSGVYINTGTWADVMCVPDGIWDSDADVGRELFRRFAGDLSTNSLDRWRRSIPTYARIEIDGPALTSAELRFADDDEAVDSAAFLRRLAATDIT